MKKYLSLFLLMLCLPLCAATLPDNMYFRAMNDEMKRTQKELRVKGSPKPFFTAYKVAYSTAQRFSAQFGAPYDSFALPQTNLEAAVYIYAGDGKNNSSGFVNDAYYYNPTSTDTIPLSYDGLRRFLWRLTDLAYVEASNSYEKKEAYKRQKNIKDNLPDFSKSPKASYVKDIPAFPTLDVKQYQQAVNDLSLLGKQLPYLEHFRVTLDVSQQDIFFLDSEGDFYQYSVPSVYFSLSAALRNQAGYTENVSDTVPLVWGKDLDRDFMLEKTQQFLTRLQDTYAAKKPEPYLGPVLLEPKAAGGFFYYLFVRNANHSKSLLSAQAETDGTAGQFKDKLGMRVMSNLLDVYDRPQEAFYKGQPLQGFMPVDDEGVLAQELQLVQGGKLLTLPTVRSPIEGQKQSNGHARMSGETYPRAALSNVFFEPKQPLGEQEMEEKLLQRCRDLELDYCYILPRFPALGGGQGELSFAWRIYSKDGHKEPVYGLRLTGVTTRSLRDILAAGDDVEVSYFVDGNTRVASSVVAPSLVVDEIEILPTQRKPDRAPFVPLP